MKALALAAVLSACLPPSPAAGAGLEVVPAGGGIRILVAKRGALSFLAHDHDFEVTRWSGTAEVPDGDPARASVELSLDAASLRDREKGLLTADRTKVEAQAAGPEVLDAGHHPRITLRSERVELAAAGPDGAARGTLRGTLGLHGREGPVAAAFEARREGATWHVRGSLRFRQSDFGMAPFVGLGGAIGVQDEVQVRFELDLRPGGRPGEAPASVPSPAAQAIPPG
jgi:polyisoprenoid-binding protein YceI